MQPLAVIVGGVTVGRGVARPARLADDELRRLVRDAQRGRPSALNALLERLRPWFLGLFARRVDRDGAGDLTQAALIRVGQALPRVDADRAVQYLVTIAMNLLRTARADFARDARRHAALEVAYPMTPPVNPDRDMEYRDLARIVHDVSRATLTPELHEVIVELLRGLRPSEIAAERNINGVTVRTRLRRARGRLGPQVRDYLVREKTQADRLYRAGPAGPGARRSTGARHRASENGSGKSERVRARRCGETSRDHCPSGGRPKRGGELHWSGLRVERDGSLSVDSS